jgi:hypothetical protein
MEPEPITISAAFAHRIGDVVTYRGCEDDENPPRFTVLSYHVEVCIGGTQAHYVVRPFVGGSGYRDGGISEKCLQVAAFEVVAYPGAEELLARKARRQVLEEEQRETMKAAKEEFRRRREATTAAAESPAQ